MWVKLEPAYVIILGGTNDILTGISAKGVQENILYMVREALNNGISPVLRMPPPLNIFQVGSFIPRSVMKSLETELSAFKNGSRNLQTK